MNLKEKLMKDYPQLNETQIEKMIAESEKEVENAERKEVRP